MIRRAKPADAQAIATIYRPFVDHGGTSFETSPPDAAEMARRMEATLEQGLPWLVYEDDRVLGYAYASLHRPRAAYQWTVESSVYLAPSARGQGVGKQLMRSLLDILTRQGFATVLAGVALPNPVSIALHEGLGFERVGVYKQVGHKRGAWHDVWWGQHFLDAPCAPEAPRHLEQIGDPGCQ